MNAIVAYASDPTFWFNVFQVILTNILLSGDNAVLIALACRGLPPRERLWGMVIGAGFASVLLIAFTAVVSVLTTKPFLQMIGGVALFYIAVKLLQPAQHDQEDTPEAVADLWRAIRIVVVADIIMSLDNVIAVGTIAKGEYVLLTIGLAVSIPLVIAGSALIMALLERFPILVWLGAAILGGVAGATLVDDPAAQPLIDAQLSGFSHGQIDTAARLIGAAFVVIAGYIWRRRHHVSLEKA
ncbi:MAG TPA: TerC family protein [Pseudolabrys sp.]|nr:TerC family protein [Pseudolabrys sp.]